jgi:hypothetical protein
MPTYQLQIKQVVDYPRCRIYRQFVRFLMEDRSIRVSGGSGLFYFTVLCSYANFRTSYRRIDGISYTVYPGEWVCTLKELSQWFRTRFQCQALAVLERLQKQNLISFQALGRGNVVRYKICDWARHNTVLEYNAPCQKDTGFFFLPVSVATDLISSDRCSEMDIVLDLWVSAIYNDNQVQGSDLGPVVYFRNGTGNPLVTYTELAARWGLSRATVGRVLKKLAALDYISLMSFPGRHGSVIYLQKYLSTMFEISDVMVDKEEVATFTDGVTPVVYFNQLDERYASQPYGTDNIGGYGCGPTAMSIVVSSLTDETVDPVAMAQWSYENGYWCKSSGSYHALIPAAAEAWGLPVSGCTTSEPQRILDALADGKLVVAIMSEGHFTSSGHFIVLRGVKDGQIMVADPASYKRSEQLWDLSIILNEASRRAGAGGPFWIIG